MRIKNLFIIVIVLTSVLSSGLFSQTLSNLERINLLVDASTKEISSATQDTTQSYKLVNKTLNEYNILNTRVVAGLSKNGIMIDNDSSLPNKISYTISDAGVEYSDLFRDGLFGEYLMGRRFDLKGHYVVEKNGVVIKSNTFELSRMDTISYNNFAFVENNSLPFTKANVPSEPFLPSIVEPVIVISAVAVTIILLFTVTSK